MKTFSTFRLLLLAIVLLTTSALSLNAQTIINLGANYPTDTPFIGKGYEVNVISPSGTPTEIQITIDGQSKEFIFTGSTLLPVNVSINKSKATLTLDQNISPFTLLAWGSSITLKSKGGTLESAHFDDASSLTLASDLSITRSVFRGNSYALLFSENAILDIGDYTLSIYDKAIQTTSAGVVAFQASIIKAGSKGKIIAYAKEIAIGHSGDILKSFRTYSSSVDDLGFLGFSYLTAPKAGNKLILVPDGGNPTKDAIATFNMDGDFKDFAVLVPAATEGTPYNLYYNP